MADDFQEAVNALVGRLKTELCKVGVDRLTHVVVEDIVYEDMPPVLTRKEDLLLALALLIEAHEAKSWPALCKAWQAFSVATSVDAEKARAMQRRRGGAGIRDEANEHLQQRREVVKTFVFAYLEKHPKASNNRIAEQYPEEDVSYETLRKHWVPEFRKEFERQQSIYTDFDDIPPQ